MQHFGINYPKIQDLREAHGFSRRDMAKTLCLSEYSYRDKEQGRKNFTTNQLINIALLFGVKIEDLILQLKLL